MAVEGGRVLAAEDDTDPVVSTSLGRTMKKRVKNYTEEEAREESRAKTQRFSPPPMV